MAKTYNSIPTVSTGDVYTATAHNNIVTNVNNYRVPPMCVLSTNAAQTATANTNTPLTYSSEVVDTDDMHSNSSNTSRITIQTAGVYLITAIVSWAGAGSDGQRVIVYLHKNGTEIDSPGYRLDMGNPSTSANLTYSMAGLVSASVNDYFELVAYSVGATRNVSASHFGAAWQGQVS